MYFTISLDAPQPPPYPSIWLVFPRVDSHWVSTFVPQDIRNRRLLLLCFRLSGGQLRHRCRSPAYHVLDQTSQNSRLTRLETLKRVIYLGDYYRNVLILASV
jgi:hypothetical protein